MDTQLQTQLNVLLIGEKCEDEYLYGDVERISPEAPVPILKYICTETHSGMSSNVKNNLESFGINVVHITNKETIKKTRVVHNGSKQQLLRIDKDVKVSPIKPSEVRSAFLHFSYDAVVVSDYDKGLLTTDDLKVICQNFNGPVFIDTKKRDLFTEKNVIFKINQREYNNLISYPEDVHLIVTMGSDGVKYLGYTYPSEKVNVFDVVGAGDTFLAAFVYSYLTCKEDRFRFSESIKYANKAAAIAVQHFGTYTLSEDDIRSLNNGNILY
jgi:D-beta-D-heptose 7-phosphate kinase/D-beta-D-heptose 1-phosphate adenosyltransferase